MTAAQQGERRLFRRPIFYFFLFADGFIFGFKLVKAIHDLYLHLKHAVTDVLRALGDESVITFFTAKKFDTEICLPAVMSVTRGAL